MVFRPLAEAGGITVGGPAGQNLGWANPTPSLDMWGNWGSREVKWLCPGSPAGQWQARNANWLSDSPFRGHSSKDTASRVGGAEGSHMHKSCQDSEEEDPGQASWKSRPAKPVSTGYLSGTGDGERNKPRHSACLANLLLPHKPGSVRKRGRSRQYLRTRSAANQTGVKRKSFY